ncbi:MAG: hypothetical protein V1903_13895 [Bacteroidota bacterium]
MKSHDQQEKMSELLHGSLSPEEEEQIITGLEKSGISRQEIEAMRSVGRLIEKTPVPEPAEKMDQRFYKMLAEEKEKIFRGDPESGAKRPLNVYLLTPGLRVAAGIALFLLGWFTSGWFGSVPADNRQIADLAGEVKQLKETLVLTMMQQSSSVERIKAVSMVSEFEVADSRIVEALVGVLNHDSNDNVRLLALEALVRYSSVPEVREDLVASISNQTSPLVQLRLTEIMVAINEKRAAPEFQKMLQDASLNYSVRGKMNEALGILL